MTNMVQCDYKGCTETEKSGVWFDKDAGWSLIAYGNEHFVLCSKHTEKFRAEWPEEDEDDVHLALAQFKEWLNGEEPTPMADA
jgi:hypothetical protein